MNISNIKNERNNFASELKNFSSKFEWIKDHNKNLPVATKAIKEAYKHFETSAMVMEEVSKNLLKSYDKILKPGISKKETEKLSQEIDDKDKIVKQRSKDL
jgi:hypothetical protein